MEVSFSRYRQSTTRKLALGLAKSLFADSIIDADESMPKTDSMAGRKFAVNFPSPQPTSRTLSVGLGSREERSLPVIFAECTKDAEAVYA